jgi:glycosyltransferase involved in cell wall biosynthesis
VGLWADKDSTCPVDFFKAWEGGAENGFSDTLGAAFHLKKAVDSFQPDLVHSFSRLAFLMPLLPFSLPKIMSYQRHTGGMNLRVCRLLSRGSLHFTGCSDFICRMGERAGGCWHHIPNFVELDRYTFQANVTPDAPLVFLSRIESIKGPDWAIRIARESGRKLIFAGNKPESGQELAFWNREVEPFLDQDKIEWIGPVNDRQKNELLGKAAALLVPIQWDEPFGIVFAEALACGTPVISCPRGALPELIRNGKEGFLIRSIAEGVEAVRSLPSLDRQASRDRAEKNYSLDTVAAQYLQLYGKLL